MPEQLLSFVGWVLAPTRIPRKSKHVGASTHPTPLIAGEDEFNAGTCQVKDLQKAQRQDVPLEADAASVIAAVKDILAGGQDASGGCGYVR